MDTEKINSFLSKLFDKKNPFATMLKYIFSTIIIVFLLKLVLGLVVDKGGFKQNNQLDEKYNAMALDSFQFKRYSKIGEEAIVFHLVETKQVDTLYVNRARIMHIRDSLKNEISFSIKDTCN
ncbi:MAG: hypothetical protein WC994_09780 [Brumimicrobium sp.]